MNRLIIFALVVAAVAWEQYADDQTKTEIQAQAEKTWDLASGWLLSALHIDTRPTPDVASTPIPENASETSTQARSKMRRRRKRALRQNRRKGCQLRNPLWRGLKQARSRLDAASTVLVQEIVAAAAPSAPHAKRTPYPERRLQRHHVLRHLLLSRRDPLYKTPDIGDVVLQSIEFLLQLRREFGHERRLNRLKLRRRRVRFRSRLFGLERPRLYID